MSKARGTVFLSMAVALGLAWPAAAQLPDFKTDHFKCYPVPIPRFVNEFVELRDQFDEIFGSQSVDAALVGSAVLFCNPVAKTEATGATSPIVNENNHLKFYRIESTLSVDPANPATAVPKHQFKVDILNQFGVQRVVVAGDATLLAVPTRKRPHGAPSGLDHFKCYRARGVAFDPPLTVLLRDQFDVEPETATVLRPALFCNPTDKRHDAGAIQRQNPDEHLTCYSYVGTAEGRRRPGVSTTNQFESGTFPVAPPRLLCVPTEKGPVGIVLDSLATAATAPATP